MVHATVVLNGLKRPASLPTELSQLSVQTLSSIPDDLENHLLETAAFLFNNQESVSVVVNNLFNKLVVNMKISVVF